MGSSAAPSAVSHPGGASRGADADPAPTAPFQGGIEGIDGIDGLIGSRPSPGGPTGPDGSAVGLPIGTVLDGRYELTARIADGGGGTVYLGRDQVLRRRVAVKVRRDSDLDQGDRFEQEARLMAGLCHPGLVTVFDAGTDVAVSDTPQAYLVLEYVDGRTLAARIAEGPLRTDEVARLAAQLASALAYVHSRGIVHRDVKPANVLLTVSPDGDTAGECIAKLTDFGVARALDGHGLTMQGLTVGTANYLSPEQASGAGTGPESDVYALGLLLLESLTGLVAFPGSGAVAAAARLHRPPLIPDSVDPAWRELLAEMTEVDPARRPMAAQVAAALAKMSRTPVGEAVLGAALIGTAGSAATGDTAAAAAAMEETAIGQTAIGQTTIGGMPMGDTAVLAPVPIAAPAPSVRRRRRWTLVALPGVAAAVAAVWIALAAGPSTSSGVPSTGPSSAKPAARPAAVSSQPAAVHASPVVATHPQPAQPTGQQQPKPAKHQPKPKH